MNTVRLEGHPCKAYRRWYPAFRASIHKRRQELATLNNTTCLMRILIDDKIPN